jgi:hypothetical protein
MSKQSKEKLKAMMMETFAGTEETGEGDFRSLITKEYAEEDVVVPDKQKEEPKPEVKPEAVVKPEPVVQKVEAKPELVEKKQEKPKATQQERVVNTNKKVEFGFDKSTSSYSLNGDLTEELVFKIIKLSMVFKGYPLEVRKTICSFYDISGENVGKVVYKVMTEDDSKLSYLETLITLKQTDAVDRAFALMSMDEYDLAGVQDLLSVFTENKRNTFNVATEKIKFCKALTQGIDALPEAALGHLKPLGEFMELGKK